MVHEKSARSKKAIPSKVRLNSLNEDLKKRLLISRGIKIPNMVMPRSADFLSCIIDNSSTDEPDPNEIAALFEEYFTRDKHYIFEFNIKGDKIIGYKDENIDRGFRCKVRSPHIEETKMQDSSDCCISSPCVTLCGNRRLLVRVLPKTRMQKLRIRRLFFADVIWLYFMERLGTFNILAALLEDFSTNGKYPFDIFDVSSIILNTLVEYTTIGLTSRTRDRESTYLRTLGWKQSHIPGKNHPGNVKINAEMNNLIHRFISLALEWYRQRRIVERKNPTPLTNASLLLIGKRIKQIKIASKAFNYGRNMVITLNGIFEVMVTFGLLFREKDKIGVPSSFTKLEDIIPTAIQNLGISKNIATAHINTYVVHYEAARSLRDILLDLEVLDFEDLNELRTWLYLSESNFEAYRTAYLAITGIDLAKSS